MKYRKQPGGFQTIMFFLGFVVLFFLVFALGVIVGKGLDTDGLFRVEKKEKKEKNKELLKSSKVTIVNKNENPEPPEISVKKEVTPIKSSSIEPAAVIKRGDVEEISKIAIDEKKAEPSNKKIINKTKNTESVKEDGLVTKINYNKPDFPVTDQGGKYTVQLGSFQNIDAAYKLEKKLQSRGYPCFVIKAAIPNKGIWYRVRVGTFNTKEKAAVYAEQIKNIEKLEFTQVTLNN